MLQHTRQTVHLGVAYIFSPQPVIDAQHSLAFQGELAKHGLVFTQTRMPPGAIVLLREPKHLEVRVQHLGAAVGTVVAISPAVWGSADEFVDDANIAFAAYSAVWPGQPLQVIQREVTVRQLYQVAEEHAFKFLWERRLRGKEEELEAFRRPVLGGGIRFHMAPAGPEDQAPDIDVRIESLFSDPSKLFIEMQMKWIRPMVAQSLDAGPLVSEADHFLANEVVDFISGAVP